MNQSTKNTKMVNLLNIINILTIVTGMILTCFSTLGEGIDSSARRDAALTAAAP